MHISKELLNDVNELNQEYKNCKKGFFSNLKSKLINFPNLINIFRPLNESENSESFLNNRNKTSLDKNNILGIFYLFISVFLLSISHLINKFLIIYYPNVENITNNFFRGIILLFISICLIKKKNIDYIGQLSRDKNKTILLLFRCFFGSLCNIFLFESFKYMRISSAFTIFCTYPIFVSVLSIIYLKSQFMTFDIISYMACMLSVIFISKPSFFFTNSESGKNDTSYGIFMSILSSIINGLGVFLNKSIALDFHNLLSIFFFGFWFIALTIILLPFTEYGFSSLDFVSLFWIIFSSVIYFWGLVLFVEALNIGDPVKILPVFYFGIVFSLLYNSFIFGKSVDFFDIFGSILIIFFNIMGTIKINSS